MGSWLFTVGMALIMVVTLLICRLSLKSDWMNSIKAAVTNTMTLIIIDSCLSLFFDMNIISLFTVNRALIIFVIFFLGLIMSVCTCLLIKYLVKFKWNTALLLSTPVFGMYLWLGSIFYKWYV